MLFASKYSPYSILAIIMLLQKKQQRKSKIKKKKKSTQKVIEPMENPKRQKIADLKN